MPLTPYNIPVGDIISINGAPWTNTGSVTGPIFPPITLFSLGGSLWQLSSTYPLMATGRDIALQGLGPNGWYDMWRGTEDDLPIELNLFGLAFSNVRAKYTLSNFCVYYGLSSDEVSCMEAGGGGIDPANCFFPRDHDCQDHDTSDHS